LEVKDMELKVWSPLLDLDREWRFDLPRFALSRELFGFDFRPSIDMVEDEGELVVTTELPGMDPAAIDVSIEGDVLTIKGEKTAETKVSEDDRYLHERSYGTFQRRIALPAGTSPDKMSATYDKGVLTVHVTLPEEKTPQALNIPVEVKT
jgi:HSP20 family protein